MPWMNTQALRICKYKVFQESSWHNSVKSTQ
jgi:hypothetical protein